MTASLLGDRNVSELICSYSSLPRLWDNSRMDALDAQTIYDPFCFSRRVLGWLTLGFWDATNESRAWWKARCIVPRPRPVVEAISRKLAPANLNRRTSNTSTCLRGRAIFTRSHPKFPRASLHGPRSSRQVTGPRCSIEPCDRARIKLAP